MQDTREVGHRERVQDTREAGHRERGVETKYHLMGTMWPLCGDINSIFSKNAQNEEMMRKFKVWG